MVNRSWEEIHFASQVIDILGLPCTQENVLHALENGAIHNSFDLYVDLGCVHLYMELGLSPDQMVTFMTNSVATRIQLFKNNTSVQNCTLLEVIQNCTLSKLSNQEK